MAANGETEIALTLTPMTVGPMYETVQITIAGADDMILVLKTQFNFVILCLLPFLFQGSQLSSMLSFIKCDLARY